MTDLYVLRKGVSEITDLKGVTATASEVNILDGATVTADELNILDDQVADASFSIGTESADVITVSVQLLNAAATAVSAPAAVLGYLASDALAMERYTITNTGDIASGTDGFVVELVDNSVFLGVSESDGDLDIAISASGTPSMYLALVLPNGALATSGAITFSSGL